MKNKKFLNGFRSWMETHHEVISHLTLSVTQSGTLAYIEHDRRGTVGLYELAEDLTDEFELKFKGINWVEDEIDFWETIELWLNSKDKESIKDYRSVKFG